MKNMTKSTLQPFGTNLRPLKTDEDHELALAEIDKLWGAEVGSPDGDRLDVLATLVEAYETERYPIGPADPIAAIRFRLDQQGQNTSSLIGILGSRTRVYEVLNGDRPLSLAMIRRLHDKLGIPAEILIQPTARVRKRRAA